MCGGLSSSVFFIAMMVSLRGGKDESEARESGKRALALECAVEPARSSFDRKTHHEHNLAEVRDVKHQ